MNRSPQKSAKKRKRRAVALSSRGLDGLVRQFTNSISALAPSDGGRRLTAAEVEGLLKYGHDGPGDHSDVDVDSELLDRVFAGLTVRGRAILLGVLRREGSRATIARRFGISIEKLEAELSKALEQGARNLDRLLRDET